MCNSFNFSLVDYNLLNTVFIGNEYSSISEGQPSTSVPIALEQIHDNEGSGIETESLDHPKIVRVNESINNFNTSENIKSVSNIEEAGISSLNTGKGNRI